MNVQSLLKNKWLVVLAIIGIACLLFGSFWSNSSSSQSPPNSPSQQGGDVGVPSAQTDSANPPGNLNDPMFALEDMYNRQLTNIISSIAGVRSASVMVTLDSTEDVILANNRTTSETVNGGSNGGKTTSTSTNVVTMHNSDGSDSPYVIQRKTPGVLGVLVTVDAQDFFIAKAEIIDAIQHVLDVPAYKISVEPKKGNR